jgi:PKD repeat protein/thiol-disulfide isomerase/thioredoxin
MNRPLLIIAIALMIAAMVGCSGSGGVDNPVAPNPGGNGLTAQVEVSPPTALPTGNSLLGYYDVVYDQEAGTVEFVQLRTAEMHFNLVPILEGGVMNVGLAGPPSVSGGILHADVKLTHPFAGKMNLSGFDVKGILITEGTETGFGDADLKIAGPHETRLVNADGFTRWWNPVEFLYSGVSGYSPGKLGMPLNPDSACILNGYKLFADSVGANDLLSAVNISQRAVFKAGSTNVRHYDISLAGGLKFNYAVDSSWAMPSPNPPVNVPGDFPPEANQAEAWFIEVTETNNTLWYLDGDWGGNVNYDITVHDWQAAGGIGAVTVEAPGVFSETTSTPKSTTEFTKSYHFDFVLPELLSNDPLDMLVTVEAEGNYNSGLTGVTKPLRAYYRHISEVSNKNPIFNKPPVPVMYATTATEILKGESISFDASESWDPDGYVTEYQWDFNGDGFYNDPYDSGTADKPTKIFNNAGIFNVRVKVRDNVSSSNISDPVEVTVTLPTNDPPVAVAEATTPTDIQEDQTVSFDGTASYDVDGTVVEWKWDFNEDGDYDDTFAGDMTTPTATFPDPGTYQVDLRVIDDLSGTDVLDEKITVEVENLMINPVAVAEATTPTGIEACDSVTFDATGSSDTDGVVEQYLWDFDGDGIYGDAYDSGTDENPTKVFSDSGSFNVDLKVIDDEALEDTLDTTIPVVVTNVDPTADLVALTPTDIYGGESVTFDAGGSEDPDCGDIVTYEWDFNGDDVFGDAYDSGTDISPEKIFIGEGAYTVKVKVTDNNGGSDTSDPQTVNVTNNPPTACAEITSSWPYMWETDIEFSAECSDDCDGTITSWEWDLDSDGSYEESGEIVTYYFATAGHHTMQVKVTDNDGDWALLDTPLDFWIYDDTNMPPVINVVNHSRTTSLKGSSAEAVSLSVDFDDPIPPGDTHTYLWSCSYGSFDNSTSATPVWTPPNQVVNCDITVQVMDGGGMFDTGTCHQWVTQWPVKPNPNSPSGGQIIPYTMKDAMTDVMIDPSVYKFPDVGPNGTVVYMNFWATWCPYCVQEMPDLDDIYNLYKDGDYLHLHIDVQETESEVENWVNANPYEADYWLLDTTGAYFLMCNNWNGDSNGIPQHVIFDRDGNCRGSQLGGIHGVGISVITQYIDQLI